MWRLIGEQADEPFDGADLAEVAERVLQLSSMAETIAMSGTEVVAVDGRTINFPSATRDRGWLIASALPRMLYRAGITLEQALSKTVNAGLRDLDQIERSVRRLDTAGFTRRSKAPLLTRLQIAYPGLQPKAVSRLLGVTPQGARKLLAAVSPSSQPVRI